ncbi:MAG: hypothetical protein Q7R40_04635 [Phaeospirillum sp.]|nr:hypothetical protein [Phaeospirillum sp.]
MSDFDLQGDSAELVAYKLMTEVRELEWRFSESGPPYNRKELMDLYAECLESVKGNRKVKP